MSNRSSLQVLISTKATILSHTTFANAASHTKKFSIRTIRVNYGSYYINTSLGVIVFQAAIETNVWKQVSKYYESVIHSCLIISVHLYPHVFPNGWRCSIAWCSALVGVHIS